jgi:hypothetical protein
LVVLGEKERVKREKRDNEREREKIKMESRKEERERERDERKARKKRTSRVQEESKKSQEQRDERKQPGPQKTDKNPKFHSRLKYLFPNCENNGQQQP